MSLLQALDFLHAGLPVVPEVRYFCCQLLCLGKFVKHVALHDTIRQSLVLVLILNVDQVLCGVFQITESDGNAVNKRSGTALSTDDASD